VRGGAGARRLEAALEDYARGVAGTGLGSMKGLLPRTLPGWDVCTWAAPRAVPLGAEDWRLILAFAIVPLLV
jgi:hypothetical protein